MNQTKTTTASSQKRELKNPSLTLYAYQIRSSNIDPDENKTDRDADSLWEKLIELADEFEIPLFKNLRELLICYESGEYCPNKEAEKLPPDLSLLLPEFCDKFSGILAGDRGIKATFDPRRLKDTYAADLTFYSEEKLTADRLHELNPQNSLSPENIRPSLGQTLLFFAKPVGEVNNYRELADTCVAELFKGQPLPQLTQEGELLDRPIFEYDNGNEKLGLSSHILVWFGGEKTAKKAAKINWMNLFCCRHKVVRVYQQSRQTYRYGRKLYAELEAKIKEFPDKVSKPKERLKYSSKQLEELPGDYLKYVGCLRDIKTHKNTVITNNKNYKNLVEKGGYPEFLERFFKKSEQWQTQIETDLNYLSPGQELFEQIVSTARGIAELDRAESDRSLERTIQVLGAGLGSGAIVASAIAGHIETPVTLNPTHPFHPAVTILFWSLIAGLFFGGIVWLITGELSLLKEKKTDGGDIN